MLNVHNKERKWKAAKEKQQVRYKGKPSRITSDFSTQGGHGKTYLRP
jgi:hypothetical protein